MCEQMRMCVGFVKEEDVIIPTHDRCCRALNSAVYCARRTPTLTLATHAERASHEGDLACRLVRLILAPWERLDEGIYEARSDVLPPTVLSMSRRAAVMEDREEGSGPKGEISMLVEVVDLKLTDILIVGIGAI